MTVKLTVQGYTSRSPRRRRRDTRLEVTVNDLRAPSSTPRKNATMVLSEASSSVVGVELAIISSATSTETVSGAVGCSVGRFDGLGTGSLEGAGIGRLEGPVGKLEGLGTGSLEGAGIGRLEGLGTGSSEGLGTGSLEGLVEGRKDTVGAGVVAAHAVWSAFENGSCSSEHATHVSSVLPYEMVCPAHEVQAVPS